MSDQEQNGVVELTPGNAELVRRLRSRTSNRKSGLTDLAADEIERMDRELSTLIACLAKIDGGDADGAVNVLRSMYFSCSDRGHFYQKRHFELKDEVATLRKQLPEGMKHCTIVFKECDRGHGALTATNWVQHPCLVCERDSLREQVAALTAQRTEHFEDINAALTRAGVNLCEIETYGGAIDSITAQRDAMVEAAEKSLSRRNEWAKEPGVGMCADTAEYVVEPVRTALARIKPGGAR